MDRKEVLINYANYLKKTNNSIYICGPVSGTDDYVERFAECEKRLRETFDGIVYNPVKICHEFFDGKAEKEEWSDLMQFVISHLSLCTHIYLMSGWEKSHGARIEQLWSEKLGLIEIREVVK